MNVFKAISDAPTALRAQREPSIQSGVDRNIKPAGALLGVSVITRGEALGHGSWIDATMLEQVAKAGNKSRGVKVRFTHPGLSGDGLGRLLGRAKHFRENGQQVFADIHFVESARQTPEGDLVEYVMKLAEESPELAGLSIVFEPDAVASARFAKEHEDADGSFESPDADNVHNYPHMRLAALRAVDVVDEPAANPDGMFSEGNAFAEAEALPLIGATILDYALGITAETPDVEGLAIHPERIRLFVGSYLAQRNLEVTSATGADNQNRKGEQMNETLQALTAEQLAKERPDLVDEIRAEDKEALSRADTEHATALSDAQAAERERCVAIATEGRALGLGDCVETLMASALSADAVIAELRGIALKELRSGAQTEVGADAETNDAGELREDAENTKLDDATKQYMAEHGVDYGTALRAVSRETGRG